MQGISPNMLKLYLECVTLFLVVHGATITRGRKVRLNKNSDGMIINNGGPADLTQGVDVRPYSLNPSFKKPSYMRRTSLRSHTPASDVVLPCMASGIKPITYTWTLDGKPLSRRKRLKFNDDRYVMISFFLF